MLNTNNGVTNNAVTTYQLYNIKGDIDGLAITLDDVATVLMLIAKGNLSPHELKALAHITADSCYNWLDIAEHQSRAIDELLKGGDV